MRAFINGVYFFVGKDEFLPIFRFEVFLDYLCGQLHLRPLHLIFVTFSIQYIHVVKDDESRQDLLQHAVSFANGVQIERVVHHVQVSQHVVLVQAAQLLHIRNEVVGQVKLLQRGQANNKH